MKSLSIIFMLLFVGWQVDARAVLTGSSENPDELDAEEIACIEELHLDRAKIEAIDVEKALPEDGEFSTFMSCTGKKKGLLTSEGKVDFAKLTEELLDVAKKDPDYEPTIFTLYKRLITASIKKCKDDVSSEESEGLTLIKTMNCISKQLVEIMES